MSVVAVKVEAGKIVMGADSFIGFGRDSQLKDKEAKIFEQNGMIIGCVGYARDCVLLRSFTATTKPAKANVDSLIDFFVHFNEWARKKISDYKNESNFMVIYDGRSFFATDQFYVLEVNTYRAMGAGAAFAQTALHLGHDVQKAIEIACELSMYCEGPVNIFEAPRIP